MSKSKISYLINTVYILYVSYCVCVVSTICVYFTLICVLIKLIIK